MNFHQHAIYSALDDDDEEEEEDLRPPLATPTTTATTNATAAAPRANIQAGGLLPLPPPPPPLEDDAPPCLPPPVFPSVSWRLLLAGVYASDAVVVGEAGRLFRCGEAAGGIHGGAGAPPGPSARPFEYLVFVPRKL